MKRLKYLNILVLLTFLAGQVQFAYTSYFCTMEHKAVQKPALAMTASMDSDGDMCNECQSVIPQKQGQQLIGSNCIKVINLEKSTVSDFASSQKSIQHFVSVSSMANQLSVISSQLSPMSYEPSAGTDSPPLDLPTLNSNLRI